MPESQVDKGPKIYPRKHRQLHPLPAALTILSLAAAGSQASRAPRSAEIFSSRQSLSQMAPDFAVSYAKGEQRGRASRSVKVDYQGKQITIPAHQFTDRGRFRGPVSGRETQSAKTTGAKARAKEGWVARAGSAAREGRQADALRSTVLWAIASPNHTEVPVQIPMTGETSLMFPVIFGGILSDSKKRNTAVLLTTAVSLLAACAPIAAPATVEKPGPAVGITHAAEVTPIPLVNEILTSTPVVPVETSVPVIASYPTAVSTVESPKVYSYGGPEGRANMDEVTRGYFDRYIAELGREKKISGTDVDALYRDFDKKYDYLLYSTNAGLTELIRSKSDGTFEVPKVDGQVTRDLKLPYDYVFQGGKLVDVGTDNFEFQQLTADRIGFVGAWPILVNVDAKDIPESWINIDKGSVVTPVETVASSIPTVEVPASALPQRVAEQTPLTPDQLNQIITDTQKDIGPYVFTADSAHPGDYAIMGTDGATIDHVFLGTDGNIYVEMSDGWKSVPARTFHFYNNELHAALYKLDPSTGKTDVVQVADVLNNDQSVWLTDSFYSDGTYEQWLMPGLKQALEKGGSSFELAFGDANPDMQFNLVSINKKFPDDFNGDGKPDSLGAEYYLPKGIRDFSPAQAQPVHWLKVPFRSFPVFTVNVDHPNTSVFPIIRYTNKPGNPYSLYPTPCDTDRINTAPDYSVNGHNYKGQSVYSEVYWPSQIALSSQVNYIGPAVSYTEDSNMDQLGDSDVVEMFKSGQNPNEATLRGILNGTSDQDPGQYLWPVTSMGLLP